MKIQNKTPRSIKPRLSTIILTLTTLTASTLSCKTHANLAKYRNKEPIKEPITEPIKEPIREQTDVPLGANTNLDWGFLKNGVEYLYLEDQFSSNVHLIKIDLFNESIKLTVSPESQKGLTPLEHAVRADAFIAINASFFDGYFSPRGVTISNGNVWAKMLKTNSSPFLFCQSENQCSMDHIGTNEINKSWINAVGGYHSLVKSREIRTTAKDAECGSFCQSLYPRSAVGITENKQFLLLMLAEGRRSEVKGLTLNQTAKIIHYAGAYDAFNLDGGGSSSLIIDGELVSLRPDKEQAIRPVSNSLMVLFQ